MEIPVLKGPAELKDFVQRCTNELFKQEPRQFNYSEDCYLGKWGEDEIRVSNKDLLKTLNGNANIYAIFVRERGSRSLWEKMYVGQRQSRYMRDRIREHLIKKNYQTGSVLEKIKTAVSLNKEVGISFINVIPDSLRLFVEDEIIRANKNTLEWNSQGKKEDSIL